MEKAAKVSSKVKAFKKLSLKLLSVLNVFPEVVGCTQDYDFSGSIWLRTPLVMNSQDYSSLRRRLHSLQKDTNEVLGHDSMASRASSIYSFSKLYSIYNYHAVIKSWT